MQYIAEIVLCRADEPGRIRIKADRPAVAAIHLQFGTMINVGLAQQCSNFGIGDVRHEVHPALARGAAFASDETIERLKKGSSGRTGKTPASRGWAISM